MKKFLLLLPFLGMLSASCSGFLDDEQKQPEITIDPPMGWGFDTRAMISKTNDMSWNLLRKSMKTGENTLLSPLSLTACLTMAGNGAAGETEKQIREFLGFSDSWEMRDVTKFLYTVMEYMHYADPKAAFTTANSFWYSNQLTPCDDFTSILNILNTENRPVDFKDKNTVNAINNWCDKKTNGLVPKLIDEISPETVALILNAIYFNASWTEQFNKSSTYPDTFYPTNGNTTTADFMHRISSELYCNHSDASIVMLPMGENKRFYTFFSLPKEDKTLDDAAVATQIALKAYADGEKMFIDSKVDMSIPKFTVKTNQSLKKTLQAMGLTLPFEEETCDFSKMFPYSRTFISDVLQGCAFTVNEDYVEAAAVTGTQYNCTSIETGSQFKLNLNRPFIYGVYEAGTGTILFNGVLEILP